MTIPMHPLARTMPGSEPNCRLNFLAWLTRRWVGDTASYRGLHASGATGPTQPNLPRQSSRSMHCVPWLRKWNDSPRTAMSGRLILYFGLLAGLPAGAFRQQVTTHVGPLRGYLLLEPDGWRMGRANGTPTSAPAESRRPHENCGPRPCGGRSG